VAGLDTGLPEDDVFYFGNAVGDTGNSAIDAKVNAFDMLGARNNQRTFTNPATVDFDFDFNRDQRVNVFDMLIARNNRTHFLNALGLITAPVAEAGKSSWLTEYEPSTPARQAVETDDSGEKTLDMLLSGK